MINANVFPHLILILALCVSITAYASSPNTAAALESAQQTNNDKPYESDNAETTDVPLESASKLEKIKKNEWVTQMRSKLTQEFCQADQYFLKCFDIDMQSCHQYVDICLSACLETISEKLPDELSNKDTRRWGPPLVYCSHEVFSRFLADKRNPSPDCESSTSTEHPPTADTIPEKSKH